MPLQPPRRSRRRTGLLSRDTIQPYIPPACIPRRSCRTIRRSATRKADFMASYQYVYVMKDLTKAFPGGREVFKGITLSFLPGVKIGVLGVNGAGKSTLMKIMAGIETEYGGEAWAAPGVTVGYLAQEPPLDPTKTVGENVEEAFADLKAALSRFNEISAKFAEPMSDEEMNKLLAEQGDLQEIIDAKDGWELDRK